MLEEKSNILVGKNRILIYVHLSEECSQKMMFVLKTTTVSQPTGSKTKIKIIKDKVPKVKYLLNYNF